MDHNRIPSSSPLKHDNLHPHTSSPTDAQPPASSSSTSSTRRASIHQPQNPQQTALTWQQEGSSPLTADRSVRGWPMSTGWQVEDLSMEVEEPLAGSSTTSSGIIASGSGSNSKGTGKKHRLSIIKNMELKPAPVDINGNKISRAPQTSPLLTSKPLDRSSSTFPAYPDLFYAQFNDQSYTASPLQPTERSLGKRRLRATSLPAPDPEFKKRRYASDIPTPSEVFDRSYAERDRPEDKMQHQRLKAKYMMEILSGRKKLNGKQRLIEQNHIGFPLIPPPPPPYPFSTHIIVAARLPPINLRTLKSLDAHEIFKQNQLRHDLLFDNLSFKPLNPGYLTSYPDLITEQTHSGNQPLNFMSSGSGAAPSQTQSDMIVTEEGDTTSGMSSATGAIRDMNKVKANCRATELYWKSIQREIESGCRCTRWQVSSDIKLDAGLDNLNGSEILKECICGEWMNDVSEDEWWKHQEGRLWPSRLPDLVRTLREILLSLMGSTTPCPNHFAHSFSREALELHERTCPTVTHALVPQLYEALDPDFLTKRVRRKAFNPAMFQMVGEAMKVHCAPIRDYLVDDMVNTALGVGRTTDLTLALRKCFDCVEIMKLDIANHQVHALRPHLWQSAVSYEMGTFENLLTVTNTKLQDSVTRKWIRESSMRILNSAKPKQRIHLIGKCKCSTNTELMIRSTVNGFIGLVFRDWVGEGEIWPPRTQKRGGFNNYIETHAEMEQIPESLRMDIRRFKIFHADIIEIALSLVILSACRDLIPTIQPNLTAKERFLHLSLISDQLEFIYTSGTLTTPNCSEDRLKEVAFQLSTLIVRPRPIETSDNSNFKSLSKEEFKQVETIKDQLYQYLSFNLKRDSPIFLRSMEGLEKIIRLKMTRQAYSLDCTDALSSNRKGTCEYDVMGDCKGLNEDKPKSLVNRKISLLRSARIKGIEEECLAENDDFENIYEDHSTNSLMVNHEEREVIWETITKYGLGIVNEEVNSLIDRMIKILGFNIECFGEMYKSSGMIVGGGAS